MTRHALVHAAIYLQLAWFSSELVLGSTIVALAPRILGMPQRVARIGNKPIVLSPYVAERAGMFALVLFSKG